jgi:isopenicillin-N N-acyltransferase-like protein
VNFVVDTSIPRGMSRVSVQGTPLQRGSQYGEQARTQVHDSITAYQRVFAHYADWDWAKVVSHAKRYQQIVEEFAPHAIEEMRGIAEGSGVEFGDILALNVRSEVMFASGAQDNKNLSGALANECSSFAVLPEATANSHTIIGQNWDWLLHAHETVVLVHARRDDGPDFVTIVEAGLLAKTGVNSAGVASCTNTLVSFLDDGAVGVPYHVLLRRLLDAESITDGVSTVVNAQKALSGNFLLGDVDGLAIDMEVNPGGATAVRTFMPSGGVLAHTNHFLSPDFARSDSRVGMSPSTLFRLNCLESSLRLGAPNLTIKNLKDALSDHRNFPVGVCAHGDERASEYERYATIASVIYDLDAHELYLAAGAPCNGYFRRYQFDSVVGLVEIDPPDDVKALHVEVQDVP